MADLAILNAAVWTVARVRPTAEAVAVRGERILAVGSNRRVQELVCPHTRVIDARGRAVLPGFNDAHVHFLSGGFHLLGVDLRRARDEDEFVHLIREHVGPLPEGQWVTGGRWDHEAWPGRRRPTRWLIDPVTPRNPVLLRRLDGHVAVANSLALGLAGICGESADPPGGTIERDAEGGEPTGVLIDRAISLVQRVIPEPDDAQRRRAARTAMERAAAVGVTSVQSVAGAQEFRTYQRLHAEGELTTRVYVLLPDALTAAAGQVGLAAAFGDGMLRCGGIKVFADGSLGAGSALLFEPYADNADSTGLCIHSEDELAELVAGIDGVGLQAVIHAIGDRATHMVLNAFERALGETGHPAARHRIEHAQVLRPDDRERFARLGVIASIQPSHCTDDMRWVESRLGDRCRIAYPYRSLVDAGARTALGTDWVVEPLNPMLGLHAAVTRELPGGGPAGGWQPQERVNLERAIEDYTLGSAYAEFQEREKGSIEVGKLADLVILSKDLLELSGGGILDCEVDVTILGGRVIFERSG